MFGNDKPSTEANAFTVDLATGALSQTKREIRSGAGPQNADAALDLAERFAYRRGVTATIRREMRRRAAVEPVIGHVKAEHRMDRNHLKGREGDRVNAVLAAAPAYKFGLLLR